MKVKATSWHYRLWKFGREFDSQPRDLCRYFWHLFLIKIVFPMIAAGFVLIGVIALVVIIWGHPLATVVAITSVLLGSVLLLDLVFLIRLLVERHQAKKKERRLQPATEPKEPSVLWTYLTARKRKMCPLIEVVRDTES